MTSSLSAVAIKRRYANQSLVVTRDGLALDIGAMPGADE
jgi:hypothetical protein